jgi:hypothetical protein
VKIIQPSFDLHDVTTIDPALIRISMGYGYMRAADVIESADDASRQLAFESSDVITQLRNQNYLDEIEYHKGPLQTPKALAFRNQVRARKTRLRNEAKRRLAHGHTMPPFAERWWLNWEWPPQPQAASSPWQRMAGDPFPPACTAVKEELARLQAELNALIDLAEREPHSGKPPPPANIKQRIAAKKTAVAAKSAEVDACIQRHPLPESCGILVKGSGPSVYIIYGGAKLGIRSPAAMDAMGYQWGDIQVIPDSTLRVLPEDKPEDGTLLKGPATPNVYVVRNGSRCWVTSPTAFDRNGFSWADIRTIPDDTLAALPVGADAT